MSIRTDCFIYSFCLNKRTIQTFKFILGWIGRQTSLILQRNSINLLDATMLFLILLFVESAGDQWSIILSFWCCWDLWLSLAVPNLVVVWPDVAHIRGVLWNKFNTARLLTRSTKPEPPLIDNRFYSRFWCSLLLWQPRTQNGHFLSFLSRYTDHLIFHHSL